MKEQHKEQHKGQREEQHKGEHKKQYKRQRERQYSFLGYWPLLFLKGIAMGTVDVIPGISGGTIALISGIYPRLVEALDALRLRHIIPLLTLLFLFYIPERRKKALAALQNVDGKFLLILVAGIAFAFLVMARVVPYILDHYSFFAFSLFFGLIAYSVRIPLRLVKNWGLFEVLALLFSLLFMLSIGFIGDKGEGNPHPLAIFLSGAIAICAMILPGISGSYILVLLGQYRLIIEAVRDFEWVIISAFFLGILIGIFSFVRLLRYLLERYHSITMAALSGLLAGSLLMIWPFKYYSFAEQIAIHHYLYALLFAALGVLLVMILDLPSQRSASSTIKSINYQKKTGAAKGS